MENRLCFKSKQREDRTDQEETTDASSHIRHSVAIPYPVPQKNLTVQVSKISIIVKQCFAAVRFILKRFLESQLRTINKYNISP